MTLQPFVQKFPDKLLVERKVWRGGWEKVICLDVGRKKEASALILLHSGGGVCGAENTITDYIHTEAEYTCQSCLINAVLLFTHSSVMNKSNNCIV